MSKTCLIFWIGVVWFLRYSAAALLGWQPPRRRLKARRRRRSEVSELLSIETLRERSVFVLCVFFLLRFTFILFFVWINFVCAFSCLFPWSFIFSHQIRIVLRSDGYCAICFKSSVAPLFVLCSPVILNPWIVWSGGCDDILLWLNLDLLIHQMVQIRPAWAHFPLLFSSTVLLFLPLFFYFLHLFPFKFFSLSLQKYFVWC